MRYTSPTIKMKLLEFDKTVEAAIACQNSANHSIVKIIADNKDSILSILEEFSLPINYQNLDDLNIKNFLSYQLNIVNNELPEKMEALRYDARILCSIWQKHLPFDFPKDGKTLYLFASPHLETCSHHNGILRKTPRYSLIYEDIETINYVVSLDTNDTNEWIESYSAPVDKLQDLDLALDVLLQHHQELEKVVLKWRLANPSHDEEIPTVDFDSEENSELTSVVAKAPLPIRVAKKIGIEIYDFFHAIFIIPFLPVFACVLAWDYFKHQQIKKRENALKNESQAISSEEPQTDQVHMPTPQPTKKHKI